MGATTASPVAAPGPAQADHPLAGRRILVTRPQAQSDALMQAIRALGGAPVSLPVIAIEPLTDAPDLDAALSACDEFDFVVFVSANAVEQAFVRMRHLDAPAEAVRCAGAPGPGTAAALRAQGVTHVIEPTGRFDSEGLAAAIDAAGLRPRRVLVLRGQDEVDRAGAGRGRDWLADWFRGRGSDVTVRACYRRRRTGKDEVNLAALLRDRRPDAVVITSSEGAQALFDLLGDAGRDWMAGARLFAPHERVVARIRSLGWSDVLETEGGDAGVLRALADVLGRSGP